MPFQAPLPDDSPPPRQPLFPTRSTTASTVDGGMSPATRTALKEVAADATRARAERDAIYQRIAGDASRAASERHDMWRKLEEQARAGDALLSDLRAESVAARAERASLFEKIAADALVADAQRRELIQTLQTVIGMSRGNPVMVASMSPPSPQQAQPPHATSVSSASTTVSMAADPLLMDQLRAAEVDKSTGASISPRTRSTCAPRRSPSPRPPH